MNCNTPNVLTPDQQTLLAAWQQHTHAEFVLKHADAALATMTENPLSIDDRNRDCMRRQSRGA